MRDILKDLYWLWRKRRSCRHISWFISDEEKARLKKVDQRIYAYARRYDPKKQRQRDRYIGVCDSDGFLLFADGTHDIL